MTKAEWLMILAILLAPLIAVQVQKYIEMLLEKYRRKLRIFYALMGTRATRLSPEHVQALNMIDIEFYGRKIFGFRYQSEAEKEVQNAWKEYLDHLCTDVTTASEEELKSWIKKGEDYFIELLSRMAKSLKYEFDKVHLKKGIYAPKGHSEIELEIHAIRKGLVDVLVKGKPLPMNVVGFPVSEEGIERQNTLNSMLIECLEGKRAIRVRMEEEIIIEKEV
jgi:hypothetical protein